MNQEQTNLHAEIQTLTELLKQSVFIHKDYLSLKEAALFLGKSESSLYKYCKDKLFPYSKPNGTILIKRTDIVTWIEKHRISSKSESKTNAIKQIRKAV